MEKLLKDFKKTPITIILIMICVVVYVVSVLLYGIEMNAAQGLTFGAYNPIYVYVNHDYYRLLTANFIHFGVLHLFVNCVSLYNLGIFVERVLKQKQYFIVLLCSALSTTLLPYLLFCINGFESYSVSGGISGVIFGVIGALGALAFRYRNVFMDVFKQLAPNLFLMLFISFVVPSISLSGHLSGMIGGFVSTYVVLMFSNKRKTNTSDLLN